MYRRVNTYDIIGLIEAFCTVVPAVKTSVASPVFRDHFINLDAIAHCLNLLESDTKLISCERDAAIKFLEALLNVPSVHFENYIDLDDEPIH